MEELQGQIIEFIFQNDVNIYTIAVVEKKYFNRIRKISLETKITKIESVPFTVDEVTLLSHPVSITHHGCFWEGITIVH